MKLRYHANLRRLRRYSDSVRFACWYPPIRRAPWHPNQPLVDALLETEHPVFVWSGGGAWYAEIIAGKLGLDFPCLDKDETAFELIHEGDVVIDDQDLGGRRTQNPFEWPETKGRLNPDQP